MPARPIIEVQQEAMESNESVFLTKDRSAYVVFR